MRRIFTHGLALSAALLLSTPVWAAEHNHAGQSAQAASLPDSTTVTASACWIRQLPVPAPSGGFLIFHNAGAQAIAVTQAHSPDYGQVMMHQTTEENGMSRMSMVHQVAVPADGDLAFKPGSYHLMLEQPRQGLQVGDQARINFVLADGHRVTAHCEIRPAKAMSGTSGHMKH